MVLCQILFSSNRVGGRASRRAAREEDEMAALDAVGDNDADPSVMLESVPQDFVFNTLKDWNGTEAGLLGCYDFPGESWAGDGSVHKGAMGAGIV